MGKFVDGVISVRDEATAVKVQDAQRAAPALRLWLLLLLGLIVGGVWLKGQSGEGLCLLTKQALDSF